MIAKWKKLKEPIAKKVLGQLIETIKYLQQSGLSHLDIKLENIICSSDFQIKLIDFGFATSEHDLLNFFCGSIYYAAPEIINSEPYYGMKADMWSCGVVLFTILNGYLPFHEEKDSKTIKEITKCRYSISKKVSESASNLIRLLLEKNPKNRILPKAVLKHKWFKKATEEKEIS
jgi:serine/threonine protein kinase